MTDIPGASEILPRLWVGDVNSAAPAVAMGAKVLCVLEASRRRSGRRGSVRYRRDERTCYAKAPAEASDRAALHAIVKRIIDVESNGDQN